jgi:hypothetical protein
MPSVTIGLECPIWSMTERASWPSATSTDAKVRRSACTVSGSGSVPSPSLASRSFAFLTARANAVSDAVAVLPGARRDVRAADLGGARFARAELAAEIAEAAEEAAWNRVAPP